MGVLRPSCGRWVEGEEARVTSTNDGLTDPGFVQEARIFLVHRESLYFFEWRDVPGLNQAP